MTDVMILVSVIGFFVWFIIGWLMVIYQWRMGGGIAMLIHNVPWLGWTIFIVAILIWPIAPLGTTAIAYCAEKIETLSTRWRRRRR